MKGLKRQDTSLVSIQKAVEKAFQPSLRAERSNLVVKEFNKIEIAASQKTLLAMTEKMFFNNRLNQN